MTAGDHGFALNADISVAGLRRKFERDGWVQIDPFLAGEGAKLLRDHLEQRDDWLLSFRMGDKPQVQLDQSS